MGGFFSQNKSKTDSIIESHKNNPQVVKLTLTKYNIYYLSKIIKLLQKHDKTIYLIRSPQHPNNLILNNEKQFDSIRKIKFPNIIFLDFNDFNLKNNEFLDLEHLNTKGSIKFSIFLKTHLF